MKCYQPDNPTSPRLVADQHEPDCTDDTCAGCVRCSRPHCASCGHRHSDSLTCPTCLNEVRDNLAAIVRECGLLPAEAAIKGIDSEAFMLNGPVADPEAREHAVMSIARGRQLEADWITVADSELHPLAVLGTWQLAAEELSYARSDELITVQTAADWLDDKLTHLAADSDFAFGEFRRDVHACLRHLEGVLRDGEQIDRGAPCLRCRVPLVKVYSNTADHDAWECPRCHDIRAEADYRLNVANVHRLNAEWLTLDELAIRLGLTREALRKRRHRAARDGQPWRSRRNPEARRTEYFVADVEPAA